MSNILSELQLTLPAPTEAELQNLKDSIRQYGVKQPIIMWHDTIVDGHMRYQIAQELGCDYDIVNMDFKDEDEARRFIIESQFARRNLNMFQKIEILHRNRFLYEIEAKKRQGQRTDLQDQPSEMMESTSAEEPKTDTEDIPVSTEKHSQSSDAKKKRDCACRSEPVSSGSNIKEGSAHVDKKKDRRSGEVNYILANKAGCSTTTFYYATKILDSKNDDLIKACRSGVMKISTAYTALQEDAKDESALSQMQQLQRKILKDANVVCQWLMAQEFVQDSEVKSEEIHNSADELLKQMEAIMDMLETLSVQDNGIFEIPGKPLALETAA